MKFTKLLLAILKDEVGISLTDLYNQEYGNSLDSPIHASGSGNSPSSSGGGSSGGGGFLNSGSLGGAGLMGLSSLLGSVLGKNKSEIYDPYAAIRADVQSYLKGKIGTSTPYEYNSAFNLDQPASEVATQKSILGYLNNPKSNVSDYSAATKKYSEDTKASMAASYADEMNKTKDMYNRLGLVSSTPGLTAQGDVAESQRLAQNQFDSELMYKNLDRELQAQGMDIGQLSDMLGKANVLGQNQVGRQQYGQQMSMQDILRKTAEASGYSGQAMGLATSEQPTNILTPNLWQNLSNTGNDVGSLMLMNSILGKK